MLCIYIYIYTLFNELNINLNLLRNTYVLPDKIGIALDYWKHLKSNHNSLFPVECSQMIMKSGWARARVFTHTHTHLSISDRWMVSQLFVVVTSILNQSSFKNKMPNTITPIKYLDKLLFYFVFRLFFLDGCYRMDRTLIRLQLVRLSIV